MGYEVVSVRNVRVYLLEKHVGAKLQKQILQRAKEVNRRGVISGEDIYYVMGDEFAEDFLARVMGSKDHSAIVDKALSSLVC